MGTTKAFWKLPVQSHCPGTSQPKRFVTICHILPPFCLHVCGVGGYTFVARGQHWLSSSIALPHTFWDRVSCWTWSSIQVQWLASELSEPSGLHFPALESKMCVQLCSAFLPECWKIEIKSSHYQLNHFPRQWVHSQAIIQPRSSHGATVYIL